MINEPQHILAKEGILTTFSIAKKVSANDVKKLKKKLKTTKIDVDKFQELLKKSVFKDTQLALNNRKIPGLIFDEEMNEGEKKKIMELTYFASVIAKKLADKKIDKYHACYIINCIVNILQLTEEDFNEFHKKFSKFKDGGIDDDGNEEALG